VGIVDASASSCATFAVITTPSFAPLLSASARRRRLHALPLDTRLEGEVFIVRHPRDDYADYTALNRSRDSWMRAFMAIVLVALLLALLVVPICVCGNPS